MRRRAAPPLTRPIVWLGLWLATPHAAGAQARTVTLPAQATAARFDTRVLISADALGAAHVGAIAVSSSGTVYVADARDMRVLAFDSAGRPGAVFGTGGAGPGEFRTIDAIALLGDTLFVVDGLQRRLTLFALDGRLIESRAWPGALRQPRLIAGGGALLARATFIRPPPAGAGRGNARAESLIQYHVIDGSAAPPPIAGLESVAAEPTGTDCATRGRIAIVGAPFASRGLRAAVTPSGALAVGERDRYAIRVVDRNTGAPMLTLARSVAALPVTDEIWEVEAARYLEVTRADGTAQCTPPLPRPATRPVINALVADDRGRFWLEVTAPRGYVLNVVDPSRSSVEEAPMPARDARVAMYARGDRLYYVALDADEVQSVHVMIRR